MGGNPVFRLAELVPARVRARTRYRRGSVLAAGLFRFDGVAVRS